MQGTWHSGMFSRSACRSTEICAQSKTPMDKEQLKRKLHPAVAQQDCSWCNALPTSKVFMGLRPYLTSAGTMTPACLDPAAYRRLTCTAFVALQNPSSAADNLSYLSFLRTYLPSGLSAKLSSALPDKCGCDPRTFQTHQTGGYTHWVNVM